MQVTIKCELVPSTSYHNFEERINKPGDQDQAIWLDISTHQTDGAMEAYIS
jgi:hypothetical protein